MLMEYKHFRLQGKNRQEREAGDGLTHGKRGNRLTVAILKKKELADLVRHQSAEQKAEGPEGRQHSKKHGDGKWANYIAEWGRAGRLEEDYMHIKGLVSESMPMPPYKPNFVHVFFC